MSLTALKGRRSTKKVARVKARTGLAGVPIDKGFTAVKDYFHLQVDRKDCIQQVKTWVKKNHGPYAKYILSHPEYMFAMTHDAATAFWYNNDIHKQYGESADNKKAVEFWSSLMDKTILLIEPGKKIFKEKQEKINNVISISPAVRLMRKINNTIMQELLDLEDKWIDGEDATINIYDRFKYHGLTNTAISHVKPMIEGWLLAVSYTHLTLPTNSSV